MNKMYKVTSGWIKWRGTKLNAGGEFLASNPTVAEQKILTKQCEPVKVMNVKVASRPIKLSKPSAKTVLSGKKKDKEGE